MQKRLISMRVKKYSLHHLLGQLIRSFDPLAQGQYAA